MHALACDSSQVTGKCMLLAFDSSQVTGKCMLWQEIALRSQGNVFCLIHLHALACDSSQVTGKCILLNSSSCSDL